MENQKTQRIYRSIMLVVISSGITFIICSLMFLTIYGILNLKSGNDFSSSNSNTFDKLSKIKDIIDEDFLFEYDEEEMMDKTASALVNSLDDVYTSYMTKEEWEDLSTEIYGNYEGVGLFLNVDDKEDEIIVVAPIEDGPAEKAGIFTGDVILKVDDEEFSGSKLDQAVKKMKGEKGTKVKLTIRRNTEIMEFELERAAVKLKAVESEVIEKDIGYISITSFSSDIAKEAKEAYNKMVEENNIKYLIVDVRDNPGGLVDEAMSLSKMFVDQGTLLITSNKKGNEKITKANNNAIVTVPTVILGNGNSASASEIFIGAVTENGKATFIGQKTFGKGVIQEILTLNDGSVLKVTTDEYYTPNKNKIHGVGVEPSIIAENTENKDVQLEKAIEFLKK